MLLMSDLKKINVRTMELAKKYKPNFDLYNNNKDFIELYDSGETFYQVFYYDRHEKGYVNQSKFNMNKEKVEELKNALKIYYQKLEEYQIIAVEESGIGKYDSEGYYYNNRVQSDFGYCHVTFHERNKIREEEKRIKEEENYYDDINCSNCGDGGCIHCEPHRFI
jgi:hypothetical protein